MKLANEAPGTPTRGSLRYSVVTVSPDASNHLLPKPPRGQWFSPVLLRLTVSPPTGSSGVPSSLPLAGCIRLRRLLKREVIFYS